MHEATGTFEIGNPFLTKEKARDLRAGLPQGHRPVPLRCLRVTTPGSTASSSRASTGVECNGTLDSCGPRTRTRSVLDQVLYQQRKATFYGLELFGELDIGRVWRGIWGIDGRYDFVHARFDDAEGGNVPRIPPHRAGLGIYYRDLNWLARLGFLHAFDQDRIGANEEADQGLYPAQRRPRLHLQARRAGALVPEMTIGLKGENLLDDDMRNHVSFKKHEVLLPGRTIRLYGTVKLN